MFNLKQEPLISLSAACRGPICETLGRRITPATACRWVKSGIRAGDGTRVVLQAVKIGRAYMTTASAVEQFFALLAKHTRAKSTVSPLLVDTATNAKLKAFGL